MEEQPSIVTEAIEDFLLKRDPPRVRILDVPVINVRVMTFAVDASLPWNISAHRLIEALKQSMDIKPELE